MHHRLLERSSCRLPLATCCADGAAPYPIHTVFGKVAWVALESSTQQACHVSKAD